MMKAVFLADVHLRKANDERSLQLLSFLDDIKEGQVRYLVDPDAVAGVVAKIDDLFIAGDLFDYWFCERDYVNPEFRFIINKLIELQKAGIRIHLCEGNHDFFMTDYFGNVLGMNVYEEWADLPIENMKALITHGDTIDRENKFYLTLRRIFRSRPFYHLQRLVPAHLRWALAGLSSQTSKKINIEKGEALAEKMMAFALEKFQSGYDVFITGHCHVPLLRHYYFDGRRKTFAALGDWIRHYSFLYYENRKFTLGYYKPHR